MEHYRNAFGVMISVIFLCMVCEGLPIGASEFESAWPPEIERAWVGPEYWANRLQDWRISGGCLECIESRAGKPLRTVHLLTHRLGSGPGDLDMSVITGLIAGDAETGSDAAVGFLIGAGNGLDYRAAALVHHSPGPGGGLFAGVDAEGRLFIGDFADPVTVVVGGNQRLHPRELARGERKTGVPERIRLHVSAVQNNGTYSLTVDAGHPGTGQALDSVTIDSIEPSRMVGNLVLVSHPGAGVTTGRFWFRDWHVSGSKLKQYEDCNCGPILSTQYTLHNGILKLTAQMMPLGRADNQEAALEIFRKDRWETAATAHVIDPGFTATFRVERWDTKRDTPYRVVYGLKQADGSLKEYTWSGTIRRDPLDKPDIVVAAFTGNHNVRRGGVERGPFEWNMEGVWFPHADIVRHVTAHRPDVLFFSGDQVYNGASPTVTDMEKPYLDYLYKWYLWCWAYRDLCRDIPAVTIPDDHDVFHGNVWGAGGRHADAQDDGGYLLPADWVNMVQRTQSSHLPDPYDPTPVEQGIEVYYTAMNYGGISFAVLEDRKFKSSPTVMIPEGKIVNGWPQNPDFDPAAQADVPGAKLLGGRQLAFLRDWAADWRGGVCMKAVLSQTLFSNVATLPAQDKSDSVVPGLQRLTADDYPENDMLVADCDSNGWPQTGRNNALREMRRGFALHISGDQHLGSTIQYGIDDWNDAGYALCVPSVANFFPRRWYPQFPGRNHKPGTPRYTGEYRDGFGNRITVHAVSNPVITGRHPILLHDKAPGYGIVRFDKDDRSITIECWPRWADPTASDARQYPGWPITINQTDNYGRKAAAYLPTLRVSGMTDPVLQVIDESDGEVVYTFRIRGNIFRPKVFGEGTYTVKIGEQEPGGMRTFSGVRALAPEMKQTLDVEF